MATILNDRDVMMRLVNPRFTPPTDRGMFLYPSSAVFKVVSGDSTPGSYTFEATLLNIPGTVNWSATAGATLTVNGNSATLTFANMTTDTAVITATIAYDGTTYTKSTTVSKIADGVKGDAGVSPNKTGTAYLWKWAPAGSPPARPNNSSTFTWAAGVNTAYAGSDGWSVAVPTNPGTPGTQLFSVAVGLSVAASAVSTTVSYASSTVVAWAQNGNNGNNGTSGVNSGEAVVFKWAATIPSGPTGPAQLTWSNGTFGAAPTGWGLTPGDAPSPGMTLWAARVFITDSAANAQTDFNWQNASIRAVGYSGNNGTGTEGASYVTAYCASVTPATTTVPANTSGRSSVPSPNGGGIVGAWTKTVPTLSAGQFLYQSDGIYNPATNTVVWSIPYWSSLKVGTLSAIISNLGVITGGEIHIGSGSNSWHVSPVGDMWSGSDSWANAPFRVSKDGYVVSRSFRTEAPNGQPLFVVDGGTATLYDGKGGVVLRSGATLAEQTQLNPNILERIDLWINEGAAWTYIDTNVTADYARNGIHKVFPNSDFALFRSRTFSLNQNTDYTLSFKATNDGAGGVREVICDLFPDDLPEGVVAVQVGMGSYELHWRTGTQASLENCQVRIFTGKNASQLLIYDVKLERGKVRTAWSDNVLDWRTINNYVAPGSIGNTQIGGDIYSNAWNGQTSTGGSGWLLQRNGDIFCNSLRARGYIATGDFNGWAWPAPGGRGSYFGPEGILLGNNIDGQGAFLEARADGTILAPGFSLVNRQLTLDNTILYNARIQVSLSATLSFTNQRNRANTFNYENFTAFATVSGAVGNLRYQWSLTVVEGDAMMTSDPSATSCSFRCRGQNITVSVNIGLVLIDEGSGAVVSRSIRCLVGYGNGA